jgi:hypothetical protein
MVSRSWKEFSRLKEQGAFLVFAGKGAGSIFGICRERSREHF